MSAFAEIKTIADVLGVRAYPDVYPGDDLNTWITYNLAEEHGDLSGDDRPNEVVQTVQVHLFIRTGQSYTALKNNIREALFDAGFTWPEVTTDYESDQKLRHIIFESEFEEV